MKHGQNRAELSDEFRYVAEISNGVGQVIAYVGMNDHRADDAREAILMIDDYEVEDVQYDRMGPNCWSYNCSGELEGNKEFLTVTIK